jgi:hypothetical protein
MPKIEITAQEREAIGAIWMAKNGRTEGERVIEIERSITKQVTRGWCRLHFGVPGGREILYRAPRSPEEIRKLNVRKWPYTRVGTGSAMNPGMNSLTELIVRPGIRKYLEPLCLYRGAMTPGGAHRRWNFALLMFAAEAETLADGLKLQANPAFAQLCGPESSLQKYSLFTFFGRLWDNPDVTDEISGFTDYVRSLELGPSRLTPVPHLSHDQYCAPWRTSDHPDYDPKAEKPEYGVRNLYYPFIAHDPKAPDDGQKIVMLVNEMVPRWLPNGIRADCCQELVVGLLSGDVPAGRAHEWVHKYVSKMYKLHPNLGRPEFTNAQQNISTNRLFVGKHEKEIPYTDRI